MSVASFAPITPTNAGLAYERKALYPEIISMLQAKKKQDAAEGKTKQFNANKGIEWLDDNRLDTTGQKPWQTEVLGGAYKTIEANAIKSIGESVDIRTDLNIRNSITDLSTQGNKFRQSNEKAKEIADNIQNGNLPNYDANAVGFAMAAEEDRAKTAFLAELSGTYVEDMGSTQPDYNAVLDRQDLKDHGGIASDYYSKYEDARTSQIASFKANGESYTGVFNLPDADMFVRNADGSLKLANDMPIVLDVAPERFVGHIIENEKEYNDSLDFRLEEAPEGTTKGMLIAQDFQENAKGVTVGSLSRVPTPSEKATPKYVDAQNQAREWATRGATAYKAGDVQQQQDWLQGMSKGGLNFTPTDTGDVQVTISKFALQNPAILAELVKEGVNVEEVLAMSKELKGDEIPLQVIDMSSGKERGGLMEILSLSQSVGNDTRNVSAEAIDEIYGSSSNTGAGELD